MPRGRRITEQEFRALQGENLQLKHDNEILKKDLEQAKIDLKYAQEYLDRTLADNKHKDNLLKLLWEELNKRKDSSD